MCCMLNEQWTEKNKQYLSVQVEDTGELFVLQVGANQKSNIPSKGSVSRKQV